MTHNKIKLIPDPPNGERLNLCAANTNMGWQVKDWTDPFEFTVGRRNFEDDRHFLFDTSIDGVVAGFRHSALEVEAAFGRESWVDGDIFANEETNRINTYMLVGTYRGFRNINLSGYAVYRDDRE